ncbi:unnamed protein product [Tuwongella immobilis]|uniref:Uncharacterized protein n=1 Tax=Tuwongella immobilis TaxID=692036 RepID=A0A6C2YI71_9BACT|nr:unnamed protein product [Tuwongella immobilis]VTR96802.1 unnamed protein product [Tuwongella immobilis]
MSVGRCPTPWPRELGPLGNPRLRSGHFPRQNLSATNPASENARRGGPPLGLLAGSNRWLSPHFCGSSADFDDVADWPIGVTRSITHAGCRFWFQVAEWRRSPMVRWRCGWQRILTWRFHRQPIRGDGSNSLQSHPPRHHRVWLRSARNGASASESLPPGSPSGPPRRAFSGVSALTPVNRSHRKMIGAKPGFAKGTQFPWPGRGTASHTHTQHNTHNPRHRQSRLKSARNGASASESLPPGSPSGPPRRAFSEAGFVADKFCLGK